MHSHVNRLSDHAIRRDGQEIRSFLRFRRCYWGLCWNHGLWCKSIWLAVATLMLTRFKNQLVHMHGINGMGGWRWLFIIEGILTCAIALIGYWLLVDFPDSGRSNWKFLSEHERAWVVARVNADRGDARPTQFNLRKFLFHML